MSSFSSPMGAMSAMGPALAAMSAGGSPSPMASFSPASYSAGPNFGSLFGAAGHSAASPMFGAGAFGHGGASGAPGGGSASSSGGLGAASSLSSMYAAAAAAAAAGGGSPVGSSSPNGFMAAGYSPYYGRR